MRLIVLSEGSGSRHPLDLVDDNGPIGGGTQGDLPQALRACLQFPVDFRFQQVDENRIRQLMVQPGGLSSTPRAEKKETFLGYAAKTTSKFHFVPHFGIIISIIIKMWGFRQLKAQSSLKKGTSRKARGKTYGDEDVWVE
jgi:hypothetical protein